ncbi:molybdopterin-dependent oxidoreductase [Chengkuizengella sp. SCS-71B]|uniref:molybdopterin-dependent oxidoreductase n=1 Tax=Chengkuizengella sp. SCS-71B TaxID=3115290 RepID=UPI0032C210B9
MKNKFNWFKIPYGKKLRNLHKWNAWVILILAITGGVLYIPSIRGDLGLVRTILKEFHIYIGFISILLLVMYIPNLFKHMKQLRKKTNQKFNLGVVLFLIIGWSLSGLVLWQYRNLPPAWTNTALFYHDLLTWIGIPYVIYHSITRLRWLNKKRIASKKEDQTAPSNQEMNDETEDNNDIQKRIVMWIEKSPISRRSFMRVSVGTLLILGIGPFFYKWMKKTLDTGGSDLTEFTAGDGNRMLPAPTPLPDSQKVIGGGSQGNYRVYTVTEIPSFSSDSWSFTITGLVGKELTWNWEQFLKIPRKVQISDFHCITGWSVYSNTWEGIPLSQLLDLAGIDSKAKYVKLYSGDGVYTDALSLEQAKLDDVMVAVLLDGKPIPQKLGGPVRLVVPQMYAYKSVKWLQAIELIEEEYMGYWEVRGYENDAWVKGRA